MRVPLGPFEVIRKARFFADQERSLEIDLHAVHEDDKGTDLMIEVKDWQKEPPLDAIRRFIRIKEALDDLKRQTVFLFYSESGLSDSAVEMLTESGVLILDPTKLARFEVFPD